MYDEDQIRRVTPRDLPHLFIGEQAWNSNALHRLALQNIEKAINPKTRNACSKLIVTIETTGAITWRDNGRGLPVEPQPWGEGERNFVDFVTWALITGNYPDEFYNWSGYLLNVGLVMCDVSERFDIETVENGDLYSVTCSRGEIVEPLRKIGETSERGTKITFLPDATVFSDVRFDGEKLSAGLREIAEKFPQVTITFEGERISGA